MSVAVSQVCSKSEAEAFQDTIQPITHTVVPHRENLNFIPFQFILRISYMLLTF